ncbi:hypothetical protein KAU32_10440, partial [bacterium]|nr:hypothetical protein [bacterium]
IYTIIYTIITNSMTNTFKRKFQLFSFSFPRRCGVFVIVFAFNLVKFISHVFDKNEVFNFIYLPNISISAYFATNATTVHGTRY